MSGLTIATLVLQLLIPLTLIAWVARSPAGDPVPAALRTTVATAYLVAIALAGLWLALPRWTLVGLAALLSIAGIRAAQRARTPGPGPDRGRARRRLRWAPIVPALALLAIVLLAAMGRRPHPGEAMDLRFPLDGGVYHVATGGSNTLLNPHVGTLEALRFRDHRGQSYAIDLVKVGGWGSRRSLFGGPAGGPGGRLDRFAIHGQPILAPCTGTVVAASDGAPDTRPKHVAPPSLEGNHVILACDGRWVVLAHMKDGTVAVEVGREVAVGDLLGRVGNSGSSDEPHLHIHAQTPGTARAPLSGTPVPMRFDNGHLVRNERVHGRSQQSDRGHDNGGTVPAEHVHADNL